VPHLRDLRGVLDREKAEMGVLLTLQPPTLPMRTEAASAGTYYSPGWGRHYPRLQILTVGELLSGKRLDAPPVGQRATTLALPLEDAEG
jgi:site-specific DNA-methyltransferase (adenine-specific)